MSENDSNQNEEYATRLNLPTRPTRADYVNAAVRTDRQREEVARCSTELAQAQERLAILLAKESEAFEAMLDSREAADS